MRWASGLLAAALLTGLGVRLPRRAPWELGLRRCDADARQLPETEPSTGPRQLELGRIAGLPIAALALPTYALLLGLLVGARRAPRRWLRFFASACLRRLLGGAVRHLEVARRVPCLWCVRTLRREPLVPFRGDRRGTRTPVALVGRRFAPSRWPRPMRRAAVAFAALLALTVAGDQALRSHVKLWPRRSARIEGEGGPRFRPCEARADRTDAHRPARQRARPRRSAASSGAGAAEAIGSRAVAPPRAGRGCPEKPRSTFNRESAAEGGRARVLGPRIRLVRGRSSR
jgi:hypothetical protein